jgi:7-dehydrocholesterol reductase
MDFAVPAAQAPSQSAGYDPKAKPGKDAVDWSSQESPFEFWANQLCVLLLVTGAPVFSSVLAYITTDEAHGTVSKFYEFCKTDGLYTCLHKAVINERSLDVGPALWFLGGFSGLALMLMLFLPGKPTKGPITQNGHVPTYTDNGMFHCVLFTFLWLVCSEEVGGGPYKLTALWDTFQAQILVLNIFGLAFCAFLLVKGFYFPSGPDSGPSGNGLLFDYYWGGELYPRLWGVDVKVLANCRFSMTYWMLSGVSFAFASLEKHGTWDPGLTLAAVSTMIYLYKFFWWELGYLRSIDIIVDRAGFYETWGVLVWVPAIYTCHMRSSVLTPSGLSWPMALGLFGASIIGVTCNFLADDQRQKFRESGGTMNVWGKPPQFIRASYKTTTAEGGTETRESLLLVSGYWGVARHFQYFFELMAAWSWCLLAGGFTHNLVSCTYCVFLTILLIHRAYRDQQKCLAKYGAAYEEYMRLVPYKIFPYVY